MRGIQYIIEKDSIAEKIKTHLRLKSISRDDGGAGGITDFSTGRAGGKARSRNGMTEFV